MILIQSPVSKDDFKNYYALRYRILRETQGQARGTEKDDYEPISIHYMAVDDQTGEVVGAVKLFEKEPGVGQFSHMCVLGTRQRQGIGRMLMGAIETKALELGYEKLGTMTRLTATKFYEKFGYHIVGLANFLPGKTQQLTWMEKELG